MLPKPAPALSPNTYAYETTPLVKPTGFREYDARWLFFFELNLFIGRPFAGHLRRLAQLVLSLCFLRPEIVVGH